MYKFVLADLDGTLTDPGIGITNSIMYALDKFGIHVKDRSELYRFIGPPLAEELQKVYGFSKEDSLLALQYYREYFAVDGLYENEVYEGIPETLEKLKASGRQLILATSKPEIYSVEILKHFDLMKYFDFIAGATMDSSRVRKSDVIAYAAESCGIDKAQALMIGDRENDIQGALSNGIQPIGVLYGYGSKEELSQAGARYYVKKPEEIPETIRRIENERKLQ